MKMPESVVLYDAGGRACVRLAEAARRRGVSRQAIHLAVQQGRLVSCTVGGTVVIPVSELEVYRPDRGRAARARAASPRGA